MNRWLNQLERKIGRHYIPNLMRYLVLGMLGVFVLEYLPLSKSAWNLLYFNRELILRGEVWRLVTFIFLPPTGSFFWILLNLYFYYFLGTALENRWGSARFNIYYAIGILGNILAGFLTGYATNFYLNTSLLLALAILYPDMEITLMFFLPVKMRWVGGAWAVYLLYQLIVSSWPARAALLLSFLPLVLFFGHDAALQLRLEGRRIKYWLNTHRK